MSGYVMRICSYDAVNLPKGKRTDYATFRRAALKAGRFSVWEACEHPALFDRLCRDPEIFTDNSCGFPWTMVRLRDVPNATNPQRQELRG